MSRLFVWQHPKKGYALYDYLRQSILTDTWWPTNQLGTVPSSTDRVEFGTCTGRISAHVKLLAATL
jgi:hypothetical protein